MAQESLPDTLDSSAAASSSSTTADHSLSQSLSLSLSLSQSASSSSSSDPTLLRNVSFSRLNAQAPEFVPTRPSTRTDPQQKQQQPRLVIPPPPPPAMMHVYPPPPPPPPFHVPIQSPVGVPSHIVPVQNPHHHHHHHGPLRNHNHQHQHQHQHNHSHNHHHGKVNYQNKQYYGGGGGLGEQEVEGAVKKGVDPDHGATSRNGISEETTHKILNQVEYYFSDLNLATTDHLMRFINKDSEGYVPISVVASFKKIKALVSSHSQLATILRNSSKLVVSEDGKKVRRQHPLTESDMEELQCRIVIAENLPEDHCHQNLMKIFSAIGSVNTIRTCQPQTSSGGGSLASRLAKADGMLFSNKLHAFVEYESVELAEKAVVELNDEGNWRIGLRVRLMLKRASKPAQTRVKKGHDGEGRHEEDDATTSEQQPNEKQLEDPSQQSDIHLQEHTVEENVNDKEGGQRKGRSRGRGKGRGRGQYHQNNRGNHVGTPPSNNLFINEPSTMAKQPPGPRMPDGTRGFAMGRGKPVAVNTA